MAVMNDLTLNPVDHDIRIHDYPGISQGADYGAYGDRAQSNYLKNTITTAANTSGALITTGRAAAAGGASFETDRVFNDTGADTRRSAANKLDDPASLPPSKSFLSVKSQDKLFRLQRM